MAIEVSGGLEAVPEVPHAIRILIVDDEMLIRWALGQALSARGCVITEAATAREALAAVRAGSFDVILMDYRLPDTTHLELLREIRATTPQARVVMMTAFGTPEMLDEARQLGVRRVLEKPIDLDVATQAILHL